jgi:glycosyltransferase involved in cell wall biosynthesis
MQEFFNKPYVQEMAPWIDGLIKLFKKRMDVELHIVAPNVFTNKDRNFTLDGVHYHFYKHLPIPGYSRFFKKVHSFLRIPYLTNFEYVKIKIRSIILAINPDIVHLHGAENAYYSAGFLRISKIYPNMVTIQGFIRNTSTRNFFTSKLISIEESVLKATSNIGIRTTEMGNISRELNPNAKLHFHNYPINIPQHVKSASERSEFDIVFFARICKDKGVEDLLESLAIVKKSRRDVSLKIIGSANGKYLSYLHSLCCKLRIDENVDFVGFIETQEEMYKVVSKAKICVLPTYHDIIPGTIIESMYLKLPVIAYSVGGIPELNINGEKILLVEKYNIVQLSEKIELLLSSEEKQNELAESAYTFIKSKYNNKEIAGDILNAYRSILGNKDQKTISL